MDNNEQDINDGDEYDSSSSAENGEENTSNVSSTRPLEYLDASADLDVVIGTKSIGEAMQLLSPNLPGLLHYYIGFFEIIIIFVGLPSKARGKYRKRRLLPQRDKEMIMRDQNRENAQRTRQRKKVYDAFLISVLQELEREMGPEVLPPNFGTEVVTLRGRPSLEIKPNDSAIMAHLVEIMQRFIILRVSQSQLEQWNDICDNQILHTMPFPTYRETTSERSKLGDKYEVKGIADVNNDTLKCNQFIKTVI